MAEIGIYEKALPSDISWLERLELVKSLGFDFLEFSVDESDERLARLDWSETEIDKVRQAVIKTKIPFRTLMLSAHRRFPLGSLDKSTREKSLDIGVKAVDLATKLGIRHIQLAGYDVFYEKKSPATHEYFMTNLAQLVNYAAGKDVMLDIETMDDPYINSLTKIQKIKEKIHSPWLQAYPDLGNLSAWPENDVKAELSNHMDLIAHIHLKDTLPVTDNFSGKFKDVPFGAGCVDFDGLFKVLVAGGYDGAYTIEMWSGDSKNPIEEIKAAQRFFDPLFEKYKIKSRKVC